MHSSDAESCLSLQEWAAENVGGLTKDQIFGMNGPNDPSNLHDLYDKAFARFKPLLDIGKMKFSQKFGNTAYTKEDLRIHANLAKPKFVELLSTFTDTIPDISFSSGSNDMNLIKSEEGFKLKLEHRRVSQITDMIRSTMICPSIVSLHDTVMKFIKYCNGIGFIENISVVNFYDNVSKFGEIDKADTDCIFGYIGIHVTILMRISNAIDGKADISSNNSTIMGEDDVGNIEVRDNDSKINFGNNSSKNGLDNDYKADKDSFTIMAEVQFHPSTIYDGTSGCLKEREVIQTVYIHVYICI